MTNKNKKRKKIRFGYFFSISVAIVSFSPEVQALTPNVILIGQLQNTNDDIAVIKKVVANSEAKYLPGWIYEIDDICISGNYATVGVSDENTGGERILKKERGSWKVIASDGGGYDETNLINIGVPSAIAKKLLQQNNCIVYPTKK